MNAQLRQFKLYSLAQVAVLASAFFLFSQNSQAHLEKLKPGAENVTPQVLEDIGITEHLGSKIDLGLSFIDEAGATVTLRDFFKSGKPVILDLAYYGCPGLCNYHLNGFAEGLQKSTLVPGKDYEWVIVSIDPKEKSDIARDKKQNMIKTFAAGRVEANQSWHFLTGEKTNIDALAKQVGFAYKWVEEDKQYAHASAAYVVTPEAVIARYLKGVMFNPQTIRFSLIEAKSGAVSTIVDSLILYCFHYDAKASKYSLQIMNIVRIAGALTALLILILVVPNILKNRRREKPL